MEILSKACFTKKMDRVTGTYRTTTTLGEEVKAFVPYPLPPSPAPILDQKMLLLLQEAYTALRELQVAATLVPSPEWFIYSFVRREAVLSSQIEGAQTTLLDLLNYETDPVHLLKMAKEPKEGSEDLLEVCNYLVALEFGFHEIQKKKGLPLSLRLIREMHKLLMKGVRGSSKQPGEFRRSQNWIGGTRPGNAHFVPPPPEEMKTCLSNLENYFHRLGSKGRYEGLVDIAMIHVQFETIHPFLDGNGRLGRLLIMLLLKHFELLDSPLLFLSLHFKRNQQEYYSLLNQVRIKGDWESWICFFLEGVIAISYEAMKDAQAIFKLFDRDRQKLLNHKNVSLPALRLFELLPEHPLLTLNQAASFLKTTKPTASKALSFLVELKILKENTGQRRHRIFGYSRYLALLIGSSSEVGRT